MSVLSRVSSNVLGPDAAALRLLRSQRLQSEKAQEQQVFWQIIRRTFNRIILSKIEMRLKIHR